MRWKKFLARELALSLGLAPQPAPGCPGCEDFAYCFGDKAKERLTRAAQQGGGG
jgi:nitrogen fixation protein NifQ